MSIYGNREIFLQGPLEVLCGRRSPPVCQGPRKHRSSPRQGVSGGAAVPGPRNARRPRRPRVGRGARLGGGVRTSVSRRPAPWAVRPRGSAGGWSASRAHASARHPSLRVALPPDSVNLSLAASLGLVRIASCAFLSREATEVPAFVGGTTPLAKTAPSMVSSRPSVRVFWPGHTSSPTIPGDFPRRQVWANSSATLLPHGSADPSRYPAVEHGTTRFSSRHQD